MEETNLRKIYLVDSENVGDLWVTHVLALARIEDEIIVFYTQKSPHMGYDTIRKLLADGREINFVKCVEGKNALDFQLVTELGYRIGCEKQKTEYIMVTNDTGFDAVVQYWKSKEKCVRRYNAKYCQNLYNQKCVDEEKQRAGIHTEQMILEEVKRKDKIAEKAIAEPLLDEGMKKHATEAVEEIKNVAKDGAKEQMEAILAESHIVKKGEKGSEKEEEAKIEFTNPYESIEDTIKEEKKAKAEKNKRNSTRGSKKEVTNKLLTEKVPGEEELLKELVSCLGVNNSGEIHNALTMLLGNDGKTVYQQVKGNLKDFCTEKQLKMQEKFNVYCQLVFEHSEQKEQYPKNFSSFVYNAKDKRKNLNSFRSALQKEYGKEKGMQYYSIIKPHVKILNKM